MNKITFLFFLFLIIFAVKSFAQPFTFQYTGLSKSFMLDLDFGNKGKGAGVKYKGQTQVIALQVKSYQLDTSGRRNGKPDIETFVWDEVIAGKVNGQYGLSKSKDVVKNSWYQRKKDGKRFFLHHVKNKKDNGNSALLVHGAFIKFNRINNNKVEIEYPDGQKTTSVLPDEDSPDARRQSYIEDYNFDGYDDLGFSIPDAGMGVYRTFGIWLYNPVSKRFEKMVEPDYTNAECSELCNVTLDKKKKLLYSTCRGGARWWQDTYRFSTKNKLIWISSKELNL
ncbi:hypothetical protein GJU39_19930 [Pedobacter petrophilus]|uniref:Uncharacterized protein n=1 Tax=Pedobacter petrophilus TaxID=1908241 RepID=A0A7K0G3G7_9SPHI|nr:hypothetical protein [Pedobacter petrophilus]MRX78357.1 hypothetical protein [Pedobacter petrophilus]